MDKRHEWDLQRALTDLWRGKGFSLGTERLMLLGYEVQFPDTASARWGINDSTRAGWGDSKSIDFLLLDPTGRLVFLEFKARMQAPADAWNALCQVTARAVEAHASYTAANLAMAFEANLSGRLGRGWPSSIPRPPADLAAAHQQFFELTRPLDFTACPGVRRVAATREPLVCDTRSQICDQFNRDPLPTTVATLRTYSMTNNPYMQHFVDNCSAWSAALFSPPVVMTTVHVP